jgi:DNA-binding NtrC family response regulator
MPPHSIPVLLALRDAESAAPIVQALLREQASVSLASPQNLPALLEQVRTQPPALLILELERSVEPLEKIRAAHPHLPVILYLAKLDGALAYAASRLGAEDMLTPPLQPAELDERLQPVLDRLRHQAPAPVPAPIHAPMPARIPTQPPAPAAAPLSPPRPPERTQQPTMVPAAPQQAPQHATQHAVYGSTTHGPMHAQPATATLQQAPAIAVPRGMAPLTGANPRMEEIRSLVAKVAATDATALIRGESGVGKEIIARMVYESSLRAGKPFVKVNCAAIPNDLLESELFGYEAGAFTGATRPKPGKFELAHTGTLFLDEIGEMHPMLQAKLLHVLQDGQFARLGAKHDISVDVRLICATNKPLEQRVAEGLFREDLYYRINVVTITVPPLRERLDEIPLLTRFFLDKYAAEYRRPQRYFSNDVQRQMLLYHWPGNVRELENLCKRFVIVGGETQILRELSQHNPQMAAARPAHASATAPGRRRAQTSAGEPSLLEIGRRAAWQAERQAILQMLELTRWNRKEAARRLQVSYKALLNKLKQMESEGAPVDLPKESQSST